MSGQSLKKSARTRRFIIEKAAPLFNSKGYAGTSMQDIIEVTGLTKGSIYGNFSGKDQLSIAVFQFNCRFLLDQVKPITLSEQGSKYKLLAIIELYRNYIFRPELRGGCPILNTAVEADDTDDKLREAVLEALDYLRRSLIYILKEGIDRGEINSAVDPDYTSTVILALIEGGIFQTKLYNKSRFLLDCLSQAEILIKEISVNE